MKYIEYLKRWRRKRDDWQINADPDADWRQMSSLLDEYMPVKDSDDGSAAGRGFRLLPIIFISLSAAAMVFVTSKVVRHEWASAKKSQVRHPHGRYSDKNLGDSSVAQYTDADTSGFFADSTSSEPADKSRSAVNSKDDKAYQLVKNLPAAGRTAEAVSATSNKDEAGKKFRGSVRNGEPDKNHSGHVSSDSTAHQKSMIYSGSNKRGHTVPSSSNRNTKGAQQEVNNYHHADKLQALLDEARQNWGFDIPQLIDPLLKYPRPRSRPLPFTNDDQKNTNPSKSGSANSSLEWGLLVGFNSPGSFTPKSQNANFYGGLAFDPFVGAYAAYHPGDKWGIGLQLRVLSPSTITGNYQIPHKIQKDSTTITTYRAQPDSRKLYSVQMPVYATYQITNFAAIKAGPVLSLPVKQFSIAKTDSASRQLLGTSHYDQKLDLGFTGGIILRYKRLSFDAAYLRGLTTHQVRSDSLSYRVHNSQLQFTIGIQLGGRKR
jgi:hypothetical protein